MALEKETVNEIEKVFQKHLEDAWRQGLETGVCAVSETILQYLSDTTVPLPEQIAKIKRFCETPLKKREQKKNA